MPTDPYAVLRALLRAEALRSARPEPGGTTPPRPPEPGLAHRPPKEPER
ncbi:hypothetical protein MTQ10_16370 [Streptomyces sp. XM83C]|jgi:hypothetical protein|uniref:Uncharacterized protein n=1 Tax=Streptomyces thermocoprophilus TaxID=78356 RepID=A0ABV5VJS9_9ACTN|nr:hypothetical protein [Streptomyces sp. XM83C]MCK1821147.1 hypothetical protein [Streptomyces sp. XM83C]